jgi:DNA uptake protein ComE-like DNA-binding protein
MRRIDDTHRIFGLVGIAVSAGLIVAGFANGSADAHGVAAKVVRQGTPGSTEGANARVRAVRVVYSGPFVTTASEGDRRVAREPAVPVQSPAAPPSSKEPEVTGAISPAPRAEPVQLASVDGGDAAADTLSSGGLDLNKASVAELNALGTGRIGKAIARGRPYASPEDLLRKRVLNRATYARIKDQVTVQ